MGAMCAKGEQKLNEQLVCGLSFRVSCAAQLAANLVEFARPVRQHEGTAAIVLRRVSRALGPVVSAAGEPTARELILQRAIETKGSLCRQCFFTTAPHHFRPCGK